MVGFNTLIGLVCVAQATFATHTLQYTLSKRSFTPKSACVINSLKLRGGSDVESGGDDQYYPIDDINQYDNEIDDDDNMSVMDDEDEHYKINVQTPKSYNKSPSSPSSQSKPSSTSSAAKPRSSSAQFIKGAEKGALYDAYNLLHTLAQDFQKPFDAPAVLVVGHQSSGKSALIEALMGFQFNQVGGGTKTRRPVALRMQYNPKCKEPKCFLQGDDGVERPTSLTEIQEYIQAENLRLEKVSTGLRGGIAMAQLSPRGNLPGGTYFSWGFSKKSTPCSLR